MVLEIWRPRAMRRWDPLREMEEMERMLERRWPFRPAQHWLEADGVTSPAIDFWEKEDAFIIRAELPGVSKEELDISVSGDILTIKGERKAPTELKDQENVCGEIFYGKFTRSISLPGAVDADKIEATLNSGILELKLPKVKKAMPSRVEIKTK